MPLHSSAEAALEELVFQRLLARLVVSALTVQSLVLQGPPVSESMSALTAIVDTKVSALRHLAPHTEGSAAAAAELTWPDLEAALNPSCQQAASSTRKSS